MSSLAAETIFSIGATPVSNALFTSSIVTVVLIILALATYSTRALLPKGFYNAMEAMGEFLLHQMDGVTQNRALSERFFPIILGVFFFVLLNNLIGQMPGIGTLGFPGGEHGGLIPLLRPATSDLNSTIAIAVVAVVASHIVGLSTGPADHVSKFFNIRGLFRSFTKGPVAILTAFVELFVGMIETFGEIAKVMSLSLRLFGNILAGEILIGVIFGLAQYAIPIPFIFFEIFVSIVQATVFTFLTLTYLTVATMTHGHDDEHAPAQAIPSAH